MLVYIKTSLYICTVKSKQQGYMSTLGIIISIVTGVMYFSIGGICAIFALAAEAETLSDKIFKWVFGIAIFLFWPVFLIGALVVEKFEQKDPLYEHFVNEGRKILEANRRKRKAEEQKKKNKENKKKNKTAGK